MGASARAELNARYTITDSRPLQDCIDTPCTAGQWDTLNPEPLTDLVDDPTGTGKPLVAVSTNDGNQYVYRLSFDSHHRLVLIPQQHAGSAPDPTTLVRH